MTRGAAGCHTSCVSTMCAGFKTPAFPPHTSPAGEVWHPHPTTAANLPKSERSASWSAVHRPTREPVPPPPEVFHATCAALKSSEGEGRRSRPASGGRPCDYVTVHRVCCRQGGSPTNAETPRVKPRARLTGYERAWRLALGLNLHAKKPPGPIPRAAATPLCALSPPIPSSFTRKP